MKRPRPRQDLKSVTVRLSPGDLERLDRIATRYGYKVERGRPGAVGRPDRTEAMRKAIRELAKRIDDEQSEDSPCATTS